MLARLVRLVINYLYRSVSPAAARISITQCACISVQAWRKRNFCGPPTPPWAFMPWPPHTACSITECGRSWPRHLAVHLTGACAVSTSPASRSRRSRCAGGTGGVIPGLGGRGAGRVGARKPLKPPPLAARAVDQEWLAVPWLRCPPVVPGAPNVPPGVRRHVRLYVTGGPASSPKQDYLSHTEPSILRRRPSSSRPCSFTTSSRGARRAGHCSAGVTTESTAPGE